MLIKIALPTCYKPRKIDLKIQLLSSIIRVDVYTILLILAVSEDMSMVSQDNNLV